MVDLLSECQSFEMKLNRVEKKLSAATSAADFAYKAVQARQKLFRLTTWTMRKRLHCLTNMTGCY
ncbi:Uncharacterised protein [Lactiplantibacillus plantarum subsp. plantarum]|nr:Uncharacterised protein [Lactiplantibacillus plantarum subsp. plantarum]